MNAADTFDSACGFCGAPVVGITGRVSFWCCTAACYLTWLRARVGPIGCGRG